MSNPYYITTPIYYVNDKPHVGHAYTSIACDALARYMRLDGRDVKFLTGTDEHGQKIEKSAAKQNKSPQEFVDEVSKTFITMGEKLSLTNDDFIRTTESRHKQAAQELWKRIEQNGYIYKGSYAGWYAVRDEAYYQESEIVEGKAPTGAEVEWVEEESYFFKLSAFEDTLLTFYEENPDAIGPKSRKNEVLSFIKGGLKDLSISRASFSWGVPVPGNDKHVMYVWMDALTNYLTALGFPDTQNNVDKFWPHSLHIVGKDIIRFHSVYWPAFLMAADIKPAQKVFAHGWWTNEGQKISKSLGNVIDPISLIDEFGLDQIRYFLLREIPFGNDGDFSKTALITRINTNLANDYGNLAQRVISFAFKHCDAQIPSPSDYTEIDTALLDKIKCVASDVKTHMNVQQISKALESIWTLISEANRYVDSQEPWALRKTDTIRMQTTLYVLMEVIRSCAILTQAFMPEASAKILDQLSVPQDNRILNDILNTPLVPKTEIDKPEGVFPRISA